MQPMKSTAASTSSEKPDTQAELFNEAESIIAEEERAHQDDTEADSAQITITYTRKKPGRKPLPKDLPGEQIRYELPKSEQVCGCGHALHEIGEDLSAAAAVSLASPT